jgi:phosphoglucosamine mutase
MDNGIKLFTGTGTKLEARHEDAIEALMASGDMGEAIVGDAIGTPRWYGDGAEQYAKFLKCTFRYEPPLSLRIGLDCANGAASVIAPALLSELGATVYVWNAEPNGTNINKCCGAVFPEFLQNKVLEEKLDVGFAFDGDADRLIAVDHLGHILDGDHILAVCAQDLLGEDQAVRRIVVSTVMANLG